MSNHVAFGPSMPPQNPVFFQGTQVLNRQAAKSRLQQLIPGTEEHSKLQDVLIKTDGIVKIILPTFSYRVDTSSEDCVLLGGFGSSEHVAIGEAVTLKFPEKNLPEKNPTLLVIGTNQLCFQHIIALAGDFYGIVGKAVSLPGGEDPEKTQRFKEAFNTLVQADHDELH